MKIFKIIGPVTEKEIIIGDDEMLEWQVIKIKDYETRTQLKTQLPSTGVTLPRGTG